MSYGAFYNVRGAREDQAASDLDLVIVLEHYSQLPALCDELSKLPGISQDCVDFFRKRITTFLSRPDLSDEHTILSQKLRMWAPGVQDSLMQWVEASPEYLLSLHFMSTSVLRWLLASDTTHFRDEVMGRRVVRDYRDRKTERDDHQRSFGGSDLKTPLNAREVPNGWLRTSRAYLIDKDDRYYPGMFQNLFQPKFAVRWGDDKVANELNTFKLKMYERFQYERCKHQYNFLQFSLSHTRREIFAPHVTRAIDAEADSLF
jgi:hypothetical protein